MWFLIAIGVCFVIVLAFFPPKGKGDEDLGEVTDERIRDFIKAGQRIQAIKAYRKLYGTGLKESKEQVEIIEAELKKPAPESTGKNKEKTDMKARL